MQKFQVTNNIWNEKYSIKILVYFFQDHHHSLLKFAAEELFSDPDLGFSFRNEATNSKALGLSLTWQKSVKTRLEDSKCKRPKELPRNSVIDDFIKIFSCTNSSFQKSKYHK